MVIIRPAEVTSRDLYFLRNSSVFVTGCVSGRPIVVGGSFSGFSSLFISLACLTARVRSVLVARIGAPVLERLRNRLSGFGFRCAGGYDGGISGGQIRNRFGLRYLLLTEGILLILPVRWCRCFARNPWIFSHDLSVGSRLPQSFLASSLILPRSSLVSVASLGKPGSLAGRHSAASSFRPASC
jgi:hypothetical protein